MTDEAMQDTHVETGEQPDNTNQQPPQDDAQQPDKGEPDDYKGAGSKDALKADLVSERKARQELAKQLTDLKSGLAAALGLETEKATPEQLAEQLTAAKAETATAQVQLAIYKAAPQGVDVGALLDSSSFTRSLAGVDPSDADAIAEKVTAFVDTNPRFRVTPAGAGSRDAHAGSGSNAGQKQDINTLLRAAAGR